MYVSIFFSLSTLVHLVRPCSMHVGILFGLRSVFYSIFICMHAWLSSALPQSTACNKDS